MNGLRPSEGSVAGREGGRFASGIGLLAGLMVSARLVDGSKALDLDVVDNRHLCEYLKRVGRRVKLTSRLLRRSRGILVFEKRMLVELISMSGFHEILRSNSSRKVPSVPTIFIFTN